MTAVDEAITEIDAALAVARPQLQGLDFFLRLDQGDKTRSALEQARADTARRIALLEAAAANLRNLTGDDYPNVPIREVPDTIMSDLADDLSVEQAAFALFASDKAVKITVAAEAPEPK